MTQWQSLAQAIHYQRTAWNNAFSMCSAMQLNGKDMLENSLNQCSWLSENEKQGYLSWAKSCIQTTENLKSLIENSFQEVEKQLADSPSTASATAKKKAKSVSQELATVQAAPKVAASPAQKKAAPKRSTALSKSAKEEPVKKVPVAKEKPAASMTKAAAAAKRKPTTAAKKKTASAPKSRAAAAAAAKKTGIRGEIRRIKKATFSPGCKTSCRPTTHG